VRLLGRHFINTYWQPLIACGAWHEGLDHLQIEAILVLLVYVIGILLLVLSVLLKGKGRNGGLNQSMHGTEQANCSQHHNYHQNYQKCTPLLNMTFIW
jgi:hypothetical protein